MAIVTKTGIIKIRTTVILLAVVMKHLGTTKGESPSRSCKQFGRCRLHRPARGWRNTGILSATGRTQCGEPVSSSKLSSLRAGIDARVTDSQDRRVYGSCAGTQDSSAPEAAAAAAA